MRKQIRARRSGAYLGPSSATRNIIIESKESWTRESSDILKCWMNHILAIGSGFFDDHVTKHIIAQQVSLFRVAHEECRTPLHFLRQKISSGGLYIERSVSFQENCNAWESLARLLFESFESMWLIPCLAVLLRNKEYLSLLLRFRSNDESVNSRKIVPHYQTMLKALQGGFAPSRAVKYFKREIQNSRRNAFSRTLLPYEAYNATILYHFLSIVFVIDKAKHLADANCETRCNPPLFQGRSEFKSCASIVKSFAKDFLQSHGDVVKYLRQIAVVFAYEAPVIESGSACSPISNIAEDLADGRKLCTIASLLTNDPTLLSIVPWSAKREHDICNSASKRRQANLHIAINQFNRVDSSRPRNFSWTEISRCILQQNTEKLVNVLWELVRLWIDQKVIPDVSVVTKETAMLQQMFLRREPCFDWSMPQRMKQGPLFGTFESQDADLSKKSDNDRSSALLTWCDAVAQLHGLRVHDWASCFLDGSVLCLLMHHYFPDRLGKSDINFLNAHDISMTASVDQVRANFTLFRNWAADLGNIPLISFDPALVLASAADSSQKVLLYSKAAQMMAAYIFARVCIQADKPQSEVCDWDTFLDRQLVLDGLEDFTSGSFASDLSQDKNAQTCHDQQHSSKSLRKHASKFQRLQNDRSVRKVLWNVDVNQACETIQHAVSSWRSRLLLANTRRAVLFVQSKYRFHCQRAELERRNKNAAIIQSVSREVLCRKNFLALPRAQSILQRAAARYLCARQKCVKETLNMLKSCKSSNGYSADICARSWADANEATIKLQQASRHCLSKHHQRRQLHMELVQQHSLNEENAFGQTTPPTPAEWLAPADGQVERPAAREAEAESAVPLETSSKQQTTSWPFLSRNLAPAVASGLHSLFCGPKLVFLPSNHLASEKNESHGEHNVGQPSHAQERVITTDHRNAYENRDSRGSVSSDDSFTSAQDDLPAAKENDDSSGSSDDAGTVHFDTPLSERQSSCPNNPLTARHEGNDQSRELFDSDTTRCPISRHDMSGNEVHSPGIFADCSEFAENTNMEYRDGSENAAFATESARIATSAVAAQVATANLMIQSTEPRQEGFVVTVSIGRRDDCAEESVFVPTADVKQNAPGLHDSESTAVDDIEWLPEQATPHDWRPPSSFSLPEHVTVSWNAAKHSPTYTIVKEGQVLDNEITPANVCSDFEDIQPVTSNDPLSLQPTPSRTFSHNLFDECVDPKQSQLTPNGITTEYNRTCDDFREFSAMNGSEDIEGSLVPIEVRFNQLSDLRNLSQEQDMDSPKFHIKLHQDRGENVEAGEGSVSNLFEVTVPVKSAYNMTVETSPGSDLENRHSCLNSTKDGLPTRSMRNESKRGCSPALVQSCKLCRDHEFDCLLKRILTFLRQSSRSTQSIESTERSLKALCAMIEAQKIPVHGVTIAEIADPTVRCLQIYTDCPQIVSLSVRVLDILLVADNIALVGSEMTSIAMRLDCVRRMLSATQRRTANFQQRQDRSRSLFEKLALDGTDRILLERNSARSSNESELREENLQKVTEVSERLSSVQVISDSKDFSQQAHHKETQFFGHANVLEQAMMILKPASLHNRQ